MLGVAIDIHTQGEDVSCRCWLSRAAKSWSPALKSLGSHGYEFLRCVLPGTELSSYDERLEDLGQSKVGQFHRPSAVHQAILDRQLTVWTKMGVVEKFQSQNNITSDATSEGGVQLELVAAVLKEDVEETALATVLPDGHGSFFSLHNKTEECGQIFKL